MNVVFIVIGRRKCVFCLIIKIEDKVNFVKQYIIIFRTFNYLFLFFWDSQKKLVLQVDLKTVKNGNREKFEKVN